MKKIINLIFKLINENFNLKFLQAKYIYDFLSEKLIY
jgi:hypothetical protein